MLAHKQLPRCWDPCTHRTTVEVSLASSQPQYTTGGGHPSTAQSKHTCAKNGRPDAVRGAPEFADAASGELAIAPACLVARSERTERVPDRGWNGGQIY